MTGSPPISILMTTDTAGGVWTYSCALASALTASGLDVHLVTMGPRARPDQLTMLRNARVRLIETDLALEWQDPGGKDVANARRVLAKLEADVAPDLIHLNGFREAAFSWNAPVLIAAHSCVNSWALACHDTDWLIEPRWRIYTDAVVAGLHQAQAWVSPTRAFYDLVNHLYRPRSPGTVIWNGLSPETGGRTKQRFIFAAGRLWDRAKNIAALAEAAKDLPWPILVAGPAGDTAPLGLTWLGNLPYAALRARLPRAAVFASPALYEPFGLSVLEAASSGCALVLSDIPSFRELWSGAALFVDPVDTRAWNRVLGEVCADDARRAELQRAACARSRTYSLDRMTSGYLHLYEALLAARSRSTTPVAMEMRA